MADRYGDNVTSKTRGSVPPGFADAANARGRVLSVNDQITLAAAPIADRIFAGTMPSSAVLKKTGKIYNAALGAGTTVSFGDKNDVAALVNAQATNAAGSFDPITTVKVGMKLWEALNYADDPRENLDLFFTIGGGAATGVLAWELDFAE